MTTLYLDTSAALKLMIDESESAALANVLDDNEAELVACHLLETELRRAAHRFDELSQQAVTEFLSGVSRYEIPSSIYREAGLLPGTSLRSLDAVHLATAVRIGVDGMVTYDRRLGDAAASLGLPVLAPS